MTGRRFTDAEIETAISARRERKTAKEIGRMLGRDHYAVQRLLERHRVTRTRVLTDADKERVRLLALSGLPHKAIAAEFGVGVSTIFKLKNVLPTASERAAAAKRFGIMLSTIDAARVDRAAARLRTTRSAIVREAVRRELERVAELESLPADYGRIL